MDVAAPTAAHEPFPPAHDPLLVDESGKAWVPHAFRVGFAAHRSIARGLGVAWWPVQEIDGVVLAIAAGNPAEPTDEAVAATLTRAGLRMLIADLQSIEDQLGAS